MWDFRTRRLTVLGPEGGLAGTVRMEETEEVRIPFLQARPPDGSFLATAANVFMAGDVRSGLVREPTRYVRFGADGSALGPVLTLPGSEAVVVSGEGLVRVQTAPVARGAEIDVGVSSPWATRPSCPPTRTSRWTPSATCGFRTTGRPVRTRAPGRGWSTTPRAGSSGRLSSPRGSTSWN